MKVLTFRALAEKIAEEEGKKHAVNIADISEILKIVRKELRQLSDEEIIAFVRLQGGGE